MRIQKSADLARAVKTRRQAQGLTQQDVADAVGIARQSLARIERGHGGASFDTVLRIFDTLGIRLEATSSEQRHIAIPIPGESNGALRQAASAAHAATRVLDASAVAEAAATAIENIDISALTSVADGITESSAVAATIQTVDTATPLARWQRALDDLTSQVQEATASGGSESPVAVARQALLNAAIEAGDPDHEGSGRGPNG